MNRPGVTKDGKIVMENYVDHVCPIVYIHWKKMLNHPTNFKAQGRNEVGMIIDKLEEMVVGSPTLVGVNNIHDTQPAICWDNNFF